MLLFWRQLRWCLTCRKNLKSSLPEGTSTASLNLLVCHKMGLSTLWSVSGLMLLIREVTFQEIAIVHSSPPSDYLRYCG